jgi:hypothetical protein
MNGLLAKEEDYTIEGIPTEAAIRELMKAGKMEELADLLKNMPATENKDLLLNTQ